MKRNASNKKNKKTEKRTCFLGGRGAGVGRGSKMKRVPPETTQKIDFLFKNCYKESCSNRGQKFGEKNWTLKVALRPSGGLLVLQNPFLLFFDRLLGALSSVNLQSTYNSVRGFLFNIILSSNKLHSTTFSSLMMVMLMMLK